ncbi:MAG: aspartate--ammonia ligase [Clostridia bacterium]|nr:aspartate--ammonia ligase [Clostridia bacterium]MBQ8513662.1 aspartate--ammonia ligase [Clostridia bacterium]
MIRIPVNYKPRLSVYETQRAIDYIKRTFQMNLAIELNLRRVSAPLFVREDSGLNDNLSGVERPVGFFVPAVGEEAQVVHSLAKWKRLALKRYEFYVGKGLYTDMNAIRRDEELDNIHSVYVDQWDWEKVIDRSMRNEEYLRTTVKKIVAAIVATNNALRYEFSQLECHIYPEVSFVTSQELENLYPALSPKERENTYVKEHPTTFLMKIGGKLASGKPHDGRAPDYDDWELNGDLLIWNDVLGQALEISSMGIRVDAEALERQLKLANCEERKYLPFHRMLLNDELPLTIGGGIGQSRLCMLMMQNAHIGEVQASIWDAATIKACDEAGIMLL